MTTNGPVIDLETGRACVDPEPLEWTGAFCKLSVRSAPIAGDALGFKCDIGVAHVVALCALENAPHGKREIELSFVGQADLDAFLRGVRSVLDALGDPSFPATLDHLRYRHAQKVLSEG